MRSLRTFSFVNEGDTDFHKSFFVDLFLSEAFLGDFLFNFLVKSVKICLVLLRAKEFYSDIYLVYLFFILDRFIMTLLKSFIIKANDCLIMVFQCCLPV